MCDAVWTEVSNRGWRAGWSVKDAGELPPGHERKGTATAGRWRALVWRHHVFGRPRCTLHDNQMANNDKITEGNKTAAGRHWGLLSRTSSITK